MHSEDVPRPDPDALLKAIQRQDGSGHRGRLKVFLGMSAGVGKTYAMLEAGRKALREGRDVVIGYVESHGRAETDALTLGLPQIPRRQVAHRGVVQPEMDLEAVLARRPELALVDELAHTNAQGSRHLKRWQDVVELLDAGIQVFTTLNVQHVESRTETVRQITGSTIYETVPDRVLDSAEIELIDLPPEELLERMQTGKIYSGERAETALFNFFREGNLSALREIALRYAAGRVSRDVQDYLQTMQIDGPWKTGERLLVAVSASPTTASMVRWTRHLADVLSAEWLAVHIQLSRPDPTAASQLTTNLDLARELGAEVVTTADEDFIRGVLRVARQRNASQIVVGKPMGGWRHRWMGFWRAHRLVQESGGVDVHFVRADAPRVGPSAPKAPNAPAEREPTSYQGYGTALMAVLVTTGINALLTPWIGHRSVALTYLVTVMGLALFLQRGPILVAAASSALLWNFCFLPPIFTFYIQTLEDGLMFSMYFVVAVVLGQLVARIRSQEQANARREEQATALYLLTRDLADAPHLDAAVTAFLGHVRLTFRCPATLCLTVPNSTTIGPPHASGDLKLDDKEASVAAWAAQHGKMAGLFTENLPSAQFLHAPIRAGDRSIGVLSLGWNPHEGLGFQQREQLDAFARQAALVLERHRLREIETEARLGLESERLGKSLLNSISHELRTPISAIAAAVNALRSDPALGSAHRQLTEEIEEANARLHRLVRNLLDVTRLETGHLKPILDWCEPRDICQAAVQDVAALMKRHPLTLSLASGLPLVQMDFVLMEQALINLLANAASHTPPGTPVELIVSTRKDGMVFEVADRGPGIPEAELSRIFDKFIRAPGAAPGGTGLGLSIVKGFVEAQGGRVEALPREGGGVRFLIRLPLGIVPTLPKEAE